MTKSGIARRGLCKSSLAVAGPLSPPPPLSLYSVLPPTFSSCCSSASRTPTITTTTTTALLTTLLYTLSSVRASLNFHDFFPSDITATIPDDPSTLPRRRFPQR